MKSTIYDTESETQQTVVLLYPNFGEKIPDENSSAEFCFHHKYCVSRLYAKYSFYGSNNPTEVFAGLEEKKRLSQAFGKVYSSLLGGIYSKILCCCL